MKLNLYQIDAFTDEVFKGNPAAVLILEQLLSTDIMQKIAAENNLAETAFVFKNGDIYEIRWFTPVVEVDLCGHATLASAYVLYNYYDFNKEAVEFYSERSGKLIVTKNDEEYTLDFPKDSLTESTIPKILEEAFNYKPVACFKGKTDFLLEFNNEDEIRNLEVDLLKIKSVGGRGVIVTSKGKDVDFVSRFFAPQSGINEDPVTGSAHTSLTPYWTEKSGKKILLAEQVSERGGKLKCELSENRVKITGKAVEYLSGIISI